MNNEFHVELKLFMRFKKYLPEGALDGKAKIAIPENSTFLDLLNILDMPADEDKIIVINGISYKQGSKANALQLKENDIVAVFPPIAGG
jgi:sulfur-carrier protein